MLARLLCVLALTLLALCACKTPDPRANEPEVHSIRIEGTQQVSAGDITKHISTTQTSWIPLAAKEHFDPDVWRTDLKRIERVYREEGYYQARVVSDEVKPLDKNRVDLVVHVEEGEPTRVARIEVSGLESLPNEHRVAAMSDIPMHVGDVFLEDSWENIKKQLANTLHELGYADAMVNGEAQVDVGTHRAAILIHVDPGSRLHFGPIKVLEHQTQVVRVSPWRIQEKAAEEIDPRDWYSDSAQAKAQQRVYQMGVFGAVKLRREPTDAATGTVPIDVDVQESPFHSLRYGFGIRVDQTRNEGHASTDFTHRNFLGGLRRLTLTATAGYAFLPSVVSYTKSGPIAKLTGEFEQPRIFHPALKFNTHLELERGIQPAYSFFGGRSRFGLIWQPLTSLSILPSYNLEAYRLDQGIADLTGTAPPLLFGCPGVCVLSYLEERVEWDRRDDKQEPHQGYLLALGIQEGGGVLGGTFKYVRFEPEARGYVSFGALKRFTLATRLKLGTLRPSTGNDLDSPIVSRFFSGGNDMRGFSSTRLSPMYITANPNTKDAYTGIPEPIGGNGLFESTLEARWNVVGPLVLALFTDTGFVTSERYNMWDTQFIAQHLLYAFGAGARYKTPIGPIRLDFAFRPNIGPPLEVYAGDSTLTSYSPRGCFGLGGKNGVRAGSPEDPCTIQLSIGEAF